MPTKTLTTGPSVVPLSVLHPVTARRVKQTKPTVTKWVRMRAKRTAVIVILHVQKCVLEITIRARSDQVKSRARLGRSIGLGSKAVVLQSANCSACNSDRSAMSLEPPARPRSTQYTVSQGLTYNKDSAEMLRNACYVPRNSSGMSSAGTAGTTPRGPICQAPGCGQRLQRRDDCPARAGALFSQPPNCRSSGRHRQSLLDK